MSEVVKDILAKIILGFACLATAALVAFVQYLFWFGKEN